MFILQRRFGGLPFVRVFKRPQQRNEPVNTAGNQPASDGGFQLIGQLEWAAAGVVAAAGGVAMLAPIRLAVAGPDDLGEVGNKWVTSG